MVAGPAAAAADALEQVLGGSALVRRSLWRRDGRIGRPGGTPSPPGPGGAEWGALPGRLKAKEKGEEVRMRRGAIIIIIIFFNGLFPRCSSLALFGQLRNQFWKRDAGTQLVQGKEEVFHPVVTLQNVELTFRLGRRTLDDDTVST